MLNRKSKVFSTLGMSVLLFLLISPEHTRAQGLPPGNQPCNKTGSFTLGFNVRNLPIATKGNICAKITILADSQISLVRYYYTAVATAGGSNLSSSFSIPLISGIPYGEKYPVRVTVEPLNYRCNNNSLPSLTFNPVSDVVYVGCSVASVPPMGPDISIDIHDPKASPCNINHPIASNAGVYAFKFERSLKLLGNSFGYVSRTIVNETGSGLLSDVRWLDHIVDNSECLIRIVLDGNEVNFPVPEKQGLLQPENFSLLFKEENYYRLPVGDGIPFCQSLRIDVVLKALRVGNHALTMKGLYISWRKSQ